MKHVFRKNLLRYSRCPMGCMGRESSEIEQKYVKWLGVEYNQKN